MKKACLLLFTCLLASAVGIGWLVHAAHQNSTSVRVLRLPHTMPSDHPVHQAMLFMAERVYEKSHGKLVLQIYPNGLLGDGSQIKELMQLGVVDIGKFSAADFEDNIPEMAAFCLPYLFRDAQHYWQVLASPLGTQILNAGYDSPARLRGLCFYDAGARSFYGREPLNTPELLRGKKVRVMVSALMVSGVEALGAVPTSMAWGELFTALQTGTVDAAENNLPSFFTSHHFEVCKYMSMSEHFRTPDVLAMGRNSWESLSPEEQAILTEAAEASSRYQRTLWTKACDDYQTQLEAAGVTFLPVDQEAMRQRVIPFYEQLRTDAQTNARKAKIMATVDAIQAIGEVK